MKFWCYILKKADEFMKIRKTLYIFLLELLFITLKPSKSQKKDRL
jgi:hypothetical protein